MLPQRFYPLVGLVVVFLALCFPLAVKADAAPPQAPPGSTIVTNDFETHVQMVSEEVVIDVQTYHGPTIVLYDDESTQEMLGDDIFSNAVLSEGDLVGRVTASFTMQNQGDEPESFEVWFPIGADDGSFGVVTVATFRAWVNGSLVETGRQETEDEFGDVLPWATWPVEFPVGEQVQLTVTYDLPPYSINQQYRFNYVLETGSGWWGVIETGTFIFRLPYEVTEENASLGAGYYGDLPIEYVPLENVTISGNEMRWEFSDLEPDSDDNIQLRILPPSVWEEILSARAGVDASPDSAESHVRLAHALTDAMAFKYGIMSGQRFVPEAVQAYEDALELAPDDVDLYVEYIEFLYRLSLPTGPMHSQLESTLMQALEIAPDDERLLQLEHYVEEFKSYYVATPTVTPTRAPTSTPSPTVTLTQAQLASTPTFDATSDAASQPTQESRGFPLGVVIVGSAIFLFALATVLRKQAGDDESAPGL